MSRRTTLPGAAELFRTTSAAEPAEAAVPLARARSLEGLASPVQPTRVEELAAVEEHVTLAAVAEPAPTPVKRSLGGVREVATSSRAPRAASVRSTRRVRPDADRSPSGRERHEEKITVYCSPEELLGLETGRLHLRAEHGLAVDRGRIVREALAVVLADLEAKGESSILVRRLREA
jgi:hypothetical protein